MKDNDFNEFRKTAWRLDRRQALLGGAIGLGGLALAGLNGSFARSSSGVAGSLSEASAIDKGVLGTGQIVPRAKRVIWMHMWGAISQVDTFDYKPLLFERHGEEIPPEVKDRGGRISGMSGSQASFPLVAPLREFKQYGQSGKWVSGLFPHTAQLVDDMTFIHSLSTEHVNHDPAAKFIHTGFQLPGRPSTGAWVNYALGTDNADLPSFVVLSSADYPSGQTMDAAAFGSGFLPSHFQGVMFRSGTDPVLYVNDPDGLSREMRRDNLNVIDELARAEYDFSRDEENLSKITQYEMAYRLQKSIPDVADISNEPQHVLELYGPDVTREGSFAKNCLTARRLAERDVKFIEVLHLGWDHHTNMATSHPRDCRLVDQPIAGLLMDLKQRGLLDDTLVVFGSEFGRTSFAQGTMTASWGRDHHGGAFTYWMAGGGVKRGHTFGSTDEYGYSVQENPVTFHDMHATIMYLLGIDHVQLTFPYQGRDFRLTDVSGEVMKDIIA